MLKNKLFLFFVVFFFISFIVFNSYSTFSKTLLCKRFQCIMINDIIVYTEAAKTPEEKQRGLSGKRSINTNEGMLFSFPERIKPAFWMKDMLFPIDIIWIANKKVVQIDENLLPPPKYSEPMIYRPNRDIDYVLEVNAFFCKKNNIRVGNSVLFL